MTSPGLPPVAAIEAEIQRFIREELLEEPFEGSDPLAEMEIDSLALEQLLDHLEIRYLVLFDAEEISRQNLATVQMLAELVRRSQTAVIDGRTSW